MKVMALPRDSNPYQRLLYSELEGHGASVRYAGELTASRTFNLLLLPAELAVLRARGWAILHLHWVFGFGFPWARRVPAARRLAQLWFRLVLVWARLLGIRIVWTAHNALPHERVFHDDVRARRALVAASDLVLAHSEATVEALRGLGAEPRRNEIVPHGPLEPEPDRELQRSPGEGVPPVRLLFFGRVAEYKGVEDLLAAVAELDDSVRIELTVAGECPDPALRARLEQLASLDGERVSLRFEYLGDAELAAALASADAVVLPFRRVTTSGSALLAMSHRRPVVLPDLPAFADLPEEAVVRYDGSADDLGRALSELARWSPQQFEAMGNAAAAYVGSTSWSEIASTVAKALHSLGADGRGADRGRLRSALAVIAGDHQYRGSLLLLANTVLLALFGFVFWALAARSYPASALGTFSGVTSSATLLGAVAALGLPNTLIRHLPGSRHARALIMCVLACVVALGGTLCLVVVLVLGPHVPRSMHLTATGSEAALLVGLVVLTSASSATDAGLVSLRATRAVLLKNVAGSVLKVAALLPLTVLGSNGIVLAYAIGTALSTGLGVLALWGRLPSWQGIRGGVSELRRQASFSIGNYAGTVFGILPLTVVPLLVIIERGARDAGWFAPALLLVGFLNFIPSTASQVFFAEASRATRSGLRELAGKAVRGTYALLLPAFALLLVGAPFVLGLFGPAYSHQSSGALRLLALGTLFTGGTYLVDAILTARDRIRAYIFMNFANAALVLAGVGLLLPQGLGAAALGWALAQAASLALGFVVLSVSGVMAELRKHPLGATVQPAGGSKTRSGTTSLGLARLGYLDGLRGLAATYVVVSHAWDTIFPRAASKHSGVGALTSFLGFGRYAVALFIVISGFSLGLAAWKKGLRWPGGARAFMRRRVRRIYPPYALAVLVGSLIGATLLAHPTGTLYDGAIPIRPSGVLVHLGLLQDLFWQGPAGSTALWSIAIEFHIYFFFLLLLVGLRRREGIWLPAAIALGALAVVSYMTSGNGTMHAISALFPSLYALFVLGVAAARFAVPGMRPNRARFELTMASLFVVAVAAELACRSRFNPLGPLNDLWLGPLFALVVSRIAAGDLRAIGRFLSSRTMVWLGSSSYSLYLIHPFLLEIVWRFAVKPLHQQPLESLVLELVLGVGVSIAASRAFYRVIERPFLGVSAPHVESPVSPSARPARRFARATGARRSPNVGAGQAVAPERHGLTEQVWSR